MTSRFGILINCAGYDWVAAMLAKQKPDETRTKNRLAAVIGKKSVALIETGKRRTVRGYADITGVDIVSYNDIERRKAAKIYGTSYDIKPGETKYFYRLENVTACDPWILDRERCINHGYSYTEWRQ